jgi:hypothetical protein
MTLGMHRRGERLHSAGERRPEGGRNDEEKGLRFSKIEYNEKHGITASDASRAGQEVTGGVVRRRCRDQSGRSMVA